VATLSFYVAKSEVEHCWTNKPWVHLYNKAFAIQRLKLVCSPNKGAVTRHRRRIDRSNSASNLRLTIATRLSTKNSVIAMPQVAINNRLRNNISSTFTFDDLHDIPCFGISLKKGRHVTSSDFQILACQIESEHHLISQLAICT
jgi:hypothetical protein